MRLATRTSRLDDGRPSTETFLWNSNGKLVRHVDPLGRVLTLNYNGLDRYNRQGVTFVFDSRQKRFRYDGEGWRELVHRYPKSPQAAEARKRLEASAAANQ